MITRKSLPLQNNLMPPANIRPIKRRHQQVQVRRQRLHHRNLIHARTHNRRHHLGRPRIHVQPRRQRRVAQRLEVALDALRAPGREVLLDARCGALGLEAERVADQVDGLIIVCDRGVNTG